MKVVVKIGGSGVEEAALLARCSHVIADLVSDGHKVAIVHGGGAALTPPSPERDSTDHWGTAAGTYRYT